MQNLWVKIIVCVLLCTGLGFLSGLVTSGQINDWYSSIQKPSWNPPNWIFGPVWTTLYILMGIAAALIWHSGHQKKNMALRYFVFQFFLNLLWSFIFFGLHQPGAAFAEIILLLVMIALTVTSFFSIHKTAGLLLLPYILWVSFATVLNGTIWWLNKAGS